MTTSPEQLDLEQSILGRRRFISAMRYAAQASIRAELPAVSWHVEQQEPDWSFALFCSSVLTHSRSEETQDAILRVVTGCLLSSESNYQQREAASLLLERVGNHLGIELAKSREMLPDAGVVDIPLGLRIDADLRADELTIPTTGGAIAGNQFQADFWSAVSKHRWVSISAPTSAGKSHIVRQWIREVFNRDQRPGFHAVYLAPTRALVEEVARQIRQDLPPEVPIVTLPWDPLADMTASCMFVVTQERLHLIQQRHPAFSPGLLFVDEAQNVADGSRGVLLSRVIDEAVSRNEHSQIILASPMASNPELFLEGRPSHVSAQALLGTTVTVLQNLLFTRQVPRQPMEYSLELVINGIPEEVGRYRLPRRATRESSRLPFVATALGGQAGGNIVYANGAAEAERVAQQIYDLLGPAAETRSSAINEAIEHVQGAVHPRYQLANVLRRGVAFHYGNMPLQVKNLIEGLFRSGDIKFLVCTSTLLEGVNLPCRNIFIRAPRKGRGRPMQPADFWNLAGRAGRWGQEFQGNIVCIDVHNDTAWPTKPGKRERRPLSRAADLDATNTAALLTYIDGGAQRPRDNDEVQSEALYSLFATRILEGRDSSSLYGIPPSLERAALYERVGVTVSGLGIRPELASRHAGISPVSMHRLLNYFIESTAFGLEYLVAPEDDDAFSSYKRALDLVDEYLGGDFGPERRRWSLSRLIVQWMRGFPLSVLIDNRVRYLRGRGEDIDLAREIRLVMETVEEIARFRAPKYLACYGDLVKEAAEVRGETLPDEFPDITMMLELGVPRTTDMSLINLGLSRASALAVAPLITDENLTPQQVRDWIMEHDISALGIPTFAVREVMRTLGLGNLDEDPGEEAS